ncbi:hypothetical protein T459_10960 [Capsicum annuum]|uniref:C3H1-type domain-containing protein n=1 Tax=Capsicum annuum TaxID=4072 RepID=A0A2G3A3P7_CAPAN|nr:hypothetical protein T459_10960 [Capsicum annuum]
MGEELPKSWKKVLFIPNAGPRVPAIVARDVRSHPLVVCTTCRDRDTSMRSHHFVCQGYRDRGPWLAIAAASIDIFQMSMTKNEEKNTKTLLEAAKNYNVKPFLSALNSCWNIDLSYEREGVRSTPFMVVCMYGSINVIILLLDTNKVFVDFRSSNGKTSLVFARENNIPDDLINRILLTGRHWIIYNFKITACPYHLRLESRLSCPYVHKNEAARRNPASVHYSPTLCKNFTMGYCREALNCRLAHGRTEINYHPNVFRTQRCFRGERCNQIDTCRHAHYGEEELLRYRAAAVPAKSPQPQENAWFPMQRPAQTQDNTAFLARGPPQQEPQLQGNDTVPTGVPMQLPQPPENAGVPPLQEAQLQDHDAVPLEYPKGALEFPFNLYRKLYPWPFRHFARMIWKQCSSSGTSAMSSSMRNGGNQLMITGVIHKPFFTLVFLLSTFFSDGNLEGSLERDDCLDTFSAC